MIFGCLHNYFRNTASFKEAPEIVASLWMTLIISINTTLFFFSWIPIFSGKLKVIVIILFVSIYYLNNRFFFSQSKIGDLVSRYDDLPNQERKFYERLTIFFLIESILAPVAGGFLKIWLL
jgi:hypothetical protein